MAQFAVGQRRLRHASFVDVLDHGNEVRRCAVRVTHQRHGQQRPARAAVAAQVALFHRVGCMVSAQHAIHQLDIGFEVIRMCDLLEGECVQRAGRVVEDVAQLRIHAQEVAVQIHHRHADGSLFEAAAKAFFALAQGLLGALAARNVAHDAQHAALAAEQQAVGVQFDRQRALAALAQEADFVGVRRLLALTDAGAEAFVPDIEELGRDHCREGQADEFLMRVAQHAGQGGVGEDEAVVLRDEYAVRHLVEQGAEERVVRFRVVRVDHDAVYCAFVKLRGHGVRSPLVVVQRPRLHCCGHRTVGWQTHRNRATSDMAPRCSAMVHPELLQTQEPDRFSGVRPTV